MFPTTTIVLQLLTIYFLLLNPKLSNANQLINLSAKSSNNGSEEQLSTSTKKNEGRGATSIFHTATTSSPSENDKLLNYDYRRVLQKEDDEPHHEGSGEGSGGSGGNGSGGSSSGK